LIAACSVGKWPRALTAQQMLDGKKLLPAERDIENAVSGSLNRPQPSFWEALRPAEREQFKSSAELRTFAAGARLMREGETANHVMVILTGQTEVRVNDRGTERVLARRGPGQLIGERAALQVNVRSATVVTLDTVRALVMQTEDFAAFLNRHNRTDAARARLQLRVALGVGAVVSDDAGVSGQVITNTNRLLDAPALKKAMRDSGTALGAVVSDFVYQDTVRQARYANPEAWTKTQVRVKQTSLRGWICENTATLQRAPQESVCA
jgi:hypothetical protein